MTPNISEDDVYKVVDAGAKIAAEVARPFGVVVQALVGLFTLPAVSIAKAVIARRHENTQEIAARANGYAIGEGTSSPYEWEESGLELPTPYLAAVDRVGAHPKSSSWYTDVGIPYFPVVAGAKNNGKVIEGQVFASTFYGGTRPMKFLLVPESTKGDIVRPIPEHFARLYLDEEKCLGAPIKDPQWTRCGHCGAPQLRQHFLSQGGIIMTFHDKRNEKQATCRHQGHKDPIPDRCPWQIATTDSENTACVVE